MTSSTKRLSAEKRRLPDDWRRSELEGSVNESEFEAQLKKDGYTEIEMLDLAARVSDLAIHSF